MEKMTRGTLKKEMRKVKKISIALSVVFLAIVFCYASAEAVVDRTVSISATGTVAAATSMSITAPVPPAGLTFGTTSADAFPTAPADNKIVISYSSNYNPWKIMVYTNNTQIPNKVGDTTGYGRYAKGGLATTDGRGVVPCKWVAKIGTNATAPTLPTPTSLHNYIKDKRDENDPATTAYDESWAAAVTGGYPNIAYGGPGGAWCVDPTNTAAGPTQYKGDVIGATSGSVAVYVDAMFGTTGATPAVPAAAGIYTSSIGFDLYHE